MHRDSIPLGATADRAAGTQFCVWAPRANRVDLQLYGPTVAVERQLPLQSIDDGYFALRVADAGPGQYYRFLLDGDRALPDPASRRQPQGVHGPSQIVDPAFTWHDPAWRARPLGDWVLYELHVGTFSPQGTFDGVLGQLDALVELGITAVELMPVAQFPGARNWGYDGVYPYAVQESYGGAEGLKRLVDACHAKGLAVVLDVVYNHLGPEGNYLAEFGPYFTPRHQTPWGPAINFEGPGSDPVRRFFIQNALMWVRDFHIDGLRLDAIHAIVDQSARPFLAELADEVHQAAAALDRPAVLIAENNRNDPRIFDSPNRGGLGLDAQIIDDFGRAVQGRLTGDNNGFYADFGLVEHVARAYQGGYVLAGQYSHYRRRRHGACSAHVPSERFFAYVQMHDQVGNRPRSDRLSTQVDFEQLKLAAATLLLGPYQPLLFMGEEYAETAPFHYFVSHGDPELVNRVRAGRKAEFAAFDWQQEPADPQAESTLAASRLDHTLRRTGKHLVLWHFYRELLALRRDWPALGQADRKLNELKFWEADGLLFSVRRHAGDELAIVLHLAAGEALLPADLSAGLTWHKLFDSAEPRWHGPGSSAPGDWEVTKTLRLAPWQALLYQRKTN